MDCPLTAFDSIVIDLGDEADRLSTLVAESIATTINGGPGNDELQEGGGPDRLDGGPGDDTLHAWTAAEPTSTSAAPGPTRSSSPALRAPQSISLDGVANDGFAGEQDNVGTDVEVVLRGRRKRHAHRHWRQRPSPWRAGFGHRGRRRRR